jgi:hypothetical protein
MVTARRPRKRQRKLIDLKERNGLIVDAGGGMTVGVIVGRSR